VRLQLAHTADLGPELETARALMCDVFADELDDHDWEHALGGIHALAWEDNVLVGHGSVVQRHLLYEGRALRTGYIEAVAVRADRRRRGYGAAIMRPLERVIQRAYELGALGASDDGAPFYAARGWKLWQGQTWALTPQGVARTKDEDIYILEVAEELDRTRPLTCDYRDGALW
jgi:aminoglycoside 2'-N-acetyltransferase I